MRSGETVLQGRERECEEIDGFIDDVAAKSGASLILTGDTGVGKTALLEYAARRAAGVRVLTAQGVRAETALPFAGLHGLLGPVLGFLPRIPPRQAAALSAGLALSPGASDDAFAVAAGTLNLLTAAAAGEGPLLVLVDDIHMLDATSRQALLFVARRTASEGVGLVLSTVEEGVEEFESGVRCRRVTPLDQDASLALLEQVSPTPVAPAVAEHLVTAAAGVPLALTELPHVLTPAQLTGAAPVPDPPPMGVRVRHAFAPRLAGLDADERAALVVVAAAGEIGFEPMCDALEALAIPVQALESAEASGVITLDGDGVSFTHPLVRAVAYHEATLAQRRAVHRALADVTPLVARAWHLGTAVLGSDEEAAQEMERTAWECCSELPVSGAAQMLERAAELTGPSDLRARRYLAATELWQLAGDAEPADELLDRVPRLTEDVAVRAHTQALLARAASLRGGPAEAHRRLVREAARVRVTDPASAAVMLLDAADASCLVGDPHAALVAVRRARLVAVRAPAALQAVCLAQHAAVLAREGRLAEARDVLGDSGAQLKQAALAPDTPVGWRRVLQVGLPCLLARLGEVDAARRMLDETIAQAWRTAALGILPAMLGARAELELRAGEWDGAQAAATDAVRLADQLGQACDAAPALVSLARLAAARGRRAECETHLERARDLVRSCGLGGLGVAIDAVEGLLELGEGDHEAAYERLERVTRRVTAGSHPDPGWVAWVGDFVEAAIGAGRADEAQRILAAVREQASGSLLLPAVVARCEALLAAYPAGERSGLAEERFGQAACHGPGGSEPFERARSELCFGEWLHTRDRPDEAVLLLRSALTTFEQLDAGPWAERARRGLVGATPKPPPISRPPVDRLRCLTPQEHRVTMLVGQGATNREAAKALFVSPKTIEFHLRGIYRKLGVRSRAELAHLIGQGGHREKSPA